MRTFFDMLADGNANAVTVFFIAAIAIGVIVKMLVR